MNTLAKVYSWISIVFWGAILVYAIANSEGAAIGGCLLLLLSSVISLVYINKYEGYLKEEKRKEQFDEMAAYLQSNPRINQ